MTEPTITDRFLHFIRENHLLNKGERILLTVSGGSDSMMLADLFLRAGFEAGIAHCNFQLRGEDSERDELFVHDFCTKANVPFYTIRFNTTSFAAGEKISIEEAARILRYDWFEKIRRQYDYDFIATAHHLNDHIETLLFNFFRSTGIHGLHGIPVKQGKIIRPMLFLTKKEVLDYIKNQHIGFVEDISNSSDKHTRNYLRHRIIPLLENVFPGLEKRLEQNIHRFSEAEQLYEQSLASHKDKLIETRGGEAFIPILKLKKSRPLSTIAYEIFKEWNFSYDQSQQIIGILDSEPGKMVSSGTHRLIRDRKWLIISPLVSQNMSRILIHEDQHLADTPDMSMSLKLLAAEGYIIPKEENTASVDAAKITYPLILRPWEQGDYFYPLGLRKKKKLSRFLIDQKLPLHEKEKVWVLESDRRIVWVMGMRIDDRFKIKPSTKHILRIRINTKRKQKQKAGNRISGMD